MVCIVIKKFTSFLPVITKFNYSKIKMTEEGRFKGPIHKHLPDLWKNSEGHGSQKRTEKYLGAVSEPGDTNWGCRVLWKKIKHR